VFAPEIVPEAKPPMPFVSSHSRELAASKSVQIFESKFIIRFLSYIRSPNIPKRLMLKRVFIVIRNS
jgi:hypothetical protein